VGKAQQQKGHMKEEKGKNLNEETAMKEGSIKWYKDDKIYLTCLIIIIIIIINKSILRRRLSITEV